MDELPVLLTAQQRQLLLELIERTPATGREARTLLNQTEQALLVAGLPEMQLVGVPGD